MRPLFEELRASYEDDPIAKGLFGDDFSSLFFVKNALGEIERKCSDIIQDLSTETSIKRIKRVVKYLLNDMSLNDRYFVELKKRVTEIIKGQPFTVNEQSNLYHLSRILLTELINGAYSQVFIYWIVKDTFYNHQKPIDNIDNALSLFWSYFDFQEKEYTVILPLRVAAFQKHFILKMFLYKAMTKDYLVVLVSG